MATTIRVCDSETGSVLAGTASDDLVRESADVDTGVVNACRDAAGVWQYVPESQVDHFRRNLREDVRTVYVEA